MSKKVKIYSIILIAVVLLVVILFTIRNSEVGQLMTAKEYMEKGSYDQAKSVYKSIIEKDELSIDARIGLVHAYVSLEEDKKALEQVEKVIQIDDSYDQVYIEYAEALTKAGRYEEAFEMLEEKLGLIALKDPDKVINFEQKDVEKVIKGYYDIYSKNILWKDIGYETEINLDFKNIYPSSTYNSSPPIESLKDLKWLVNLKKINISGRNVHANISVLSNLINLERIHMKPTDVYGDISNLKKLKNLDWIELASTNVEGDISNLRNLEKLVICELRSTKVEGDISSFKNLKQLTWINLHGTSIVGDISVFSGLNKLDRILLTNTNVTGNINALEKLNELIWIELIKTKVSGNISSLKDLSTLRKIELDET